MVVDIEFTFPVPNAMYFYVRMESTKSIYRIHQETCIHRVIVNIYIIIVMNSSHVSVNLTCFPSTNTRGRKNYAWRLQETPPPRASAKSRPSC